MPYCRECGHKVEDAAPAPKPAPAKFVQITHSPITGNFVVVSRGHAGGEYRPSRIHSTVEDATWDARQRLLGERS